MNIPIWLLILSSLVAAAFTWFLTKTRLSSSLLQLTERLQMKEDRLQELSSQKALLDVQVDKLREENTSYNQKTTELKTRIEEIERSHQDKLTLLKDAEEKLSHTFRSLSADALKNNNQSFMDLAKTQLERFQQGAKTDLDKRQENIAGLIQPIRDTLGKVGERIGEIEKARIGSYSSLTKQIETLMESERSLQKETSNLVAALRAPQARGRWGEIQLKRVVEMAGMLEHCDFEEQASTNIEGGQLRPDLVVRLPGGKNIVVDAKTPLSSYLDALHCDSFDDKKKHFLEHAKHIRKHIDQLSRKAYWDQFQPTPEFVVLFLPGESFFSAALEQDPSLIEVGVTQNVIIATPTTLIALLRSVAYGWRQESLAKDAQKIGELGKELYKRLSDMTAHLSRLGKSLSGSVDSYNRTVRSLENRVLVTARRFDELNVDHREANLEALPPIEVAAIELQAPELMD